MRSPRLQHAAHHEPLPPSHAASSEPATGAVVEQDLLRTAYTSVTSGDLAQLEQTLQKDKSILNAPSGLENYCLLHQACLRGNFEIVRFLLDSGADPMVRDARGWTVLHCTLVSHSPLTLQIIQLFLSRPNVPRQVCGVDFLLIWGFFSSFFLSILSFFHTQVQVRLTNLISHSLSLTHTYILTPPLTRPPLNSTPLIYPPLPFLLPSHPPFPFSYGVSARHQAIPYFIILFDSVTQRRTPPYLKTYFTAFLSLDLTLMSKPIEVSHLYTKRQSPVAAMSFVFF